MKRLTLAEMTSNKQIFSTAFEDFLDTWNEVKHRRYSFKIKEIALLTEQSPNKIYRHLHRLYAMGLLKITQKGKRQEKTFIRTNQ